MKLGIPPGMIVFVLGLIGMIFVLADDAGEIGSKIPLALFFLFIMGVGIVVYLYPPNEEEVYGEMVNRGSIG